MSTTTVTLENTRRDVKEIGPISTDKGNVLIRLGSTCDHGLVGTVGWYLLDNGSAKSKERASELKGKTPAPRVTVPNWVWNEIKDLPAVKYYTDREIVRVR